MELDITKTQTLLAAMEQIPQAKSFLRNRYFPTNPQIDIFPTEEVLMDYTDGDRCVAPYVVPRVGGIDVDRRGFVTDRFTPAKIAPRRKLTIDDLKKRGFGESVFSGITPEQREAVMILKDGKELSNMITRREEIMSAEVMTTNACIIKSIATADDINPEERTVKFYTEAANPAEYTPAIAWDKPNANIVGDLKVMIEILRKKGIAATDLVVGAGVSQTITSDPVIQKLFDIARFDFGGIKPEELPNGASKIGRINIEGTMLDIISYTETYQDDKGVDQPFFPAGKVTLTSAATGRGLYGAVTQLEQTDNQFHTYPSARVPKYYADHENNARYLTITASPIFVPNQKNCFITAEVLTAATETTEGEGV